MDKKISSLVQSQFPESVRDQYPALIQFVEAYFKFLELEKNPQDIITNLLSYADVDRTLDEFVSKFEKTYIDGLPQEIAGNKRMFIKHVRDLYQTKGTEESFRILFRLLFNEEVELYYPKQQMLRVSDGKWTQRNSIMVRVTSGDAITSINKKIKIRTSSGVINTFIENVVDLGDGIFELYINKNFKNTINPDDVVTGLNFSAICLPTLVSASVITAGQGFHMGQVFDIVSPSGSGAKVKVTSIDSNGGIKRVAFISFGNGYEGDILVSLQPSARKSGSVDPYKSYTNGFIEQVLITKPTYFKSDYVQVDYSGMVVGSSYLNDYKPDNADTTSIFPAQVLFKLGSLCSYRGEYTSADGFLSDVNMIQDGYIYQDFSYVIKTKQRLADYASVVKKLVHPAGTMMFGELQGETNIELANFFDYMRVLSAQKTIKDSFTAGDSISINTSKRGLTDAVRTSDSISINTTKGAFTDTVITDDSAISALMLTYVDPTYFSGSYAGSIIF